eukprot:gene13397-9220_t
MDSLVAGAFAGLVVDLTLYPIDTIKTRIQSKEGFWASGGVRNIYKGLSAVAIGSIPGGAAFFFAYDTTKTSLFRCLDPDYRPSKDVPTGVTAIAVQSVAASIGECAACCIRVPTEMVKQQLQAGKHHSARRALHCITNNVGPESENSGGTAAFFTTPLDVIKTRIMLQHHLSFRGIRHVVHDIASEPCRPNDIFGTPQKFFRGASARVFWISAGGSIFFSAYEFCKLCLLFVSLILDVALHLVMAYSLRSLLHYLLFSVLLLLLFFMKKFMLGAKASLGMAPKTEDPEYEKLNAAMRGLEDALNSYQAAARTIESAAKDMTLALAKMSKVFESFGDADGHTAGQKSAATAMVDLAGTAENHYLKTLRNALSPSNLKTMTDAIAEEKKLSGPRNSTMNDYDVYRDAVAKKEADYAKKNKPLSDSKLYEEEVAKRDANKVAFEEANKVYKEKCNEIIRNREKFVNETLTNFLTSTAMFLGNLEKDLVACSKKAKVVLLYIQIDVERTFSFIIFLFFIFSRKNSIRLAASVQAFRDRLIFLEAVKYFRKMQLFGHRDTRKKIGLLFDHFIF